MASGLLDDEVDPELHEFYRFDPEAPIPLEESSNNVVVPPIILPRDETDAVYAQVSQVIDSLMPSVVIEGLFGGISTQFVDPTHFAWILCYKSARFSLPT